MRLNTCAKLATGSALALALSAGSASGALVGAGTSIPNDSGDTVNGTGTTPANGTRGNVDQSAPLQLSAGTYTITSFLYDAAQAGETTPFLSFRPGADGNTYQVLAVGTLRTITAAAQDQNVPFGGNNTFTLTAPTTVYAGIYTGDQRTNPVALDDGVPSTDHDSSPTAPVVGGTVGAFSNPDLNRRYAFAFDIVPEPTGLAAVGFGALAMLRRRRAAR